MKKSMKLLAILLFVVLMSGCVKYNFKMEVGKDKSVSIEIIDAIEKDYTSYGSYETEAAAAETKGFTKTPYEDDEYVGYTLTKKYSNIDDISTDKPITVELMDILSSDKEEPKAYFQKKGGLFKTTYVASFIVDKSSGEEEEEDTTTTTTPEDETEEESNITYTVVLPVKPNSNDATFVSEDGKTLTWNLYDDRLNKINYEFSMINTTMIIIVAAVAVLVVGGVIFVVAKGKKKPNNGGAMPNGMPMPAPGQQPAMPGQPMADPMIPQDNQGFINQGPQPNPMDANPLGAVVQPQPMENNMFGQPAPEQNFMPADGMPSLENQPPIVAEQPAPVDFGQPAPFPEVNLEAAPEVAAAEVPAVGLENNMDTVVMPPVETPVMETPAVEEPVVTPEVAAPEAMPVETPEVAPMEMPEVAIDPNNNNVQ